MQYLGGKSRISSKIIELINQYRTPGQAVLEPFCGALNITHKLGGKVIASDANAYLIELYRALQIGSIELPDSITREEYQFIRDNKEVNKALSAFAGFGCSFGGKWFAGYASNATGQDYCGAAKRSLLRKMAGCKSVNFFSCGYEWHQPHGMIVYSDPPYLGTTGYSGVGAFDHANFWATMREWSKENVVLISEYAAPADFEIVMEIETRLDMQSQGDKSRIERVFKLNQ